MRCIITLTRPMDLTRIRLIFSPFELMENTMNWQELSSSSHYKTAIAVKDEIATGN